MRIVLLTPSACDDPSARSILRPLAAEYARHGHDVTLAGQQKPYLERPAEEAADWGRVVRLGGPSRNRLAHAVRLALESRRCLRTADFVHARVNGQADFRMLVVLIVCAVGAVPFGVTFDDFDNPSHRPRSTQGRWRLAAVERLLRPARWVSASSRYIASKLEGAMPSLRGRVKVVPYGVGDGETAAADAPSGPFFLCLARLMPYKGIDLLLMAWAQACLRFPGVELVVYGHDDTGGHYQRLARHLGLSDRVRFVTEQDEAVKWALLRSCLFAVLPSRHEAFGLSIVEAMACGRPVLATRSGGPEEIVRDGRNGLLVESGRVPALRDGLAALLSDRALRERLGVQARADARGYDQGTAAAKFLSAMAGRDA